MIDECMKTIDDHQTFYYMEMVSDCWLFLRLQFLTSIFIGVLSLGMVSHKISIITIFGHKHFRPEFHIRIL